MKYIRILSGNKIIQYDENAKDLDKPAILFYKDDIREADKVEELVDCFIAVDKNGQLCGDPMVAKGHCFKSFCNYYKANHMDVDCYLAILTNKGLIFVAKMNEKEEKVELL